MMNRRVCNMVEAIQSNIDILTWADARESVVMHNPDFAAVIDALNPGKELKLIKVRYPFGQHILKQGKLQLPNDDGNWVDIDDASIDKKIRDNLSYAKTMPIGVVLKNSIELYMKKANRSVPYSMMKVGKIFALWNALEISESAHLGRVWDITSGARTISLLPKISDATSFKNIQREFNIQKTQLNTLYDQWSMFVNLAKRPNFPDDWCSELLFFTGEWMNKKDDKKWMALRQYFLESAWHDTAFLRNQVVFDFTISCALETKNLKPNPYLTDTIKHLYGIGVGAYPAFVFARDDSAAPVKAIQQVFADVYKLKYVPSIIHPGYFSPDDMSSPSYYSLEAPTLMVFSPKSRKASSKLDDLREIKHIMDGVSSYIQENSLGLENTPIYKWVHSVKQEYFHTDPNQEIDHIMNTTQLCQDDRAIKLDAERFQHLDFCHTSPILRGCIRISSAQSER